MKQRRKIGTWSVISGSPPVFVGLAGAAILALQKQVLEMLFILLLVVIHHYSGKLLNRVYLSSDQVADWTAVRLLTTVCCLGLPFYIVLTLS